MATAVSSYLPYMYHQQQYYYPTLPSISSPPPPVYNNYYTPPQPQSPVYNNYYAPPQPQPQPQKQKQKITVQYVEPSKESMPPRREPRVYRQVIRLPTPEPVYRQVRHRMPTPEREHINRTIIKKANGDVVVQQQRSATKPRTQSRSETTKQPRQSRSRQIHTD
jgi:hypothetical protein